MKRAALVFLKLGGSLISDKSKPASFRKKAVARIGREIVEAMKADGSLRLLLGHGGGAAAHFPAAKHRTASGLPGGGGWRGFVETRRGVMTMNRRVLDALAEGGLHPVLVPPVASVVCRNGRIAQWDTCVIETLLAADQMPLIHGDAVLDRTLGFTICSTETLFAFLAGRLKPARIVLASDVEGVYLEKSEPPRGVELVPCGRGRARVRCVHPGNVAALRKCLRDATSSDRKADVTGGMAAKIAELYAMTRHRPELQGRIVSGLRSGEVKAALLGEDVGTAVCGARPTRAG